MNNYAVYDTTGMITKTISTDPETILLNLDGMEFIEIDENVDVSDVTHYVSEGEVTERPKVTEETEVTIAPNGVDAWSLAVPEGTWAQLQGNVLEEVEGGQIIFTTVYPGTYTLIIEPPFPFQRQEIIINAD